MTKSAKGTVESLGKRVKENSELNREISDSCWGLDSVRVRLKTLGKWNDW